MTKSSSMYILGYTVWLMDFEFSYMCLQICNILDVSERCKFCQLMIHALVNGPHCASNIYIDLHMHADLCIVLIYSFSYIVILLIFRITVMHYFLFFIHIIFSFLHSLFIQATFRVEYVDRGLVTLATGGEVTTYIHMSFHMMAILRYMLYLYHIT